MECNMTPIGQHKLPPLPYDLEALEPVIGRETLRIHHNILHKGYVDGLNEAELSMAAARKKGDYQYIKYWENQLAYTGSGHILHSIYWTIMAPPGMGGTPGPHTMHQINCYFGTFNSFKEQFEKASLKVEASGWGVLTWQPTWKRLEILQAGKQQNLTQWSGIPILVCDVWEHAYYLDFQYRRGEFIKDWWELINWYEVERRLLMAMDGLVPLSLMDRCL